MTMIGFQIFLLLLVIVALLVALPILGLLPWPAGPTEKGAKSTGWLLHENSNKVGTESTPAQIEAPGPLMADASREQARLSFYFTEYKNQDAQRDPVDALHDAEQLLHWTQTIKALMSDPALPYRLGQRLEWAFRHPADPQTVAIAELLVMHNRQRCSKLGVLDPHTSSRL